MSQFTLRTLLFMLLIVGAGTTLARLMGQWLPYQGEIRYLLSGSQGLITAYTMDVGHGQSFRLFAPQSVHNRGWSAMARYVFLSLEGTTIINVDDSTTRPCLLCPLSLFGRRMISRLAFEGIDHYGDKEPAIYTANGDGTEVTRLLPDEAGDFRNPGLFPRQHAVDL
ncbi:MAG: hypothetical protein U0694_09030 [Anaerolineae bacterium]